MVGGVLAAVAFGISIVFSKAANKVGIGIGPYLLITGVTVLIIGFIFLAITRDTTVSWTSGLHSVGMGAFWALGIGLVAIALTKYGMPLSKLAPLFNINTLIAVGLGLWIFAEWKDVNVVKLLVGAALIIVGSIFVGVA